MSRHRSPCPALLALVLGLACLPSAWASEPAGFIIVNLGGRGNQSKAQSFLSDFSKALETSWPEGVAGPPGWAGRYHVHEADALASVRREVPRFGLVSAEFYLRHREALGLVPVLAPRRRPEVSSLAHLVVLTASFDEERHAQDGIRGWTIGGPPIAEPTWCSLVLLAGLPGRESVTFNGPSRTLAGLRALRAGRVEGLLLSDAEWQRLTALGKTEGLSSIHQSDEVPEGPVVAFGGAAGSPRWAEALLAFTETSAGRAVLARMDLSGFAAARASDYDAVQALHGGAPSVPVSPRQ